MKIIETGIKDLVIIEPRIYKDDRGFFFESYNKQKFKEVGITADFVQDNQSKSVYGVIRGLHYQLSPYSQAKLVSVIHGKVLDVAVDLRKDSPTFGQSFSVELSAENKNYFFIPRGFAHGFSVLTETATFFYKCDNLYNKDSEAGIKFDDLNLNIDWQTPKDKQIISDKDLIAPSFNNAKMNF